MDPRLESIYLHEIADECEFALLAVTEVNSLLRDGQTSTEHFFRAAQDFVQHAAAASRIVWPPQKAGVRAVTRGQHLQRVLQVDNTHPLQSSRSLRNHLEHFDERLDDWVQSTSQGNLLDRIILPHRSKINLGSVVNERDIFRLFETETLCYVFRGQEFDLQNICSGVEDMQNRTRARLRAIQHR